MRTIFHSCILLFFAGTLQIAAMLWFAHPNGNRCPAPGACVDPGMQRM